MLWWVSMTPLGRPVVPLVYWMLAMSSTIDVVGQAAFGVEEGGPLGRVEVDGVLEFQVEAVAGAAEDFFVVGALVFVPEEEGLHARALRVNCSSWER
jgi:pentose-5-phosphate-3-epimerase